MKALALDARVILMDEPTGWLAASEVAKLHATIRALKARGVGIVYISHVLDEIFAVCDTMTIMRDGKVIAESAIAEIDRPRLVSLMVGDRLARESAQAAHGKRRPRGNGEVRLSARNLTKHGVFRDVTFDLYAGEILCITGLIGSKRTELVRTLFGSDRFDSGTLEIEGKSVAFGAPTGAIASGIGFVPEDRHREGLMLDMTVTENLAMATLGRFRHGLPVAPPPDGRGGTTNDLEPVDQSTRRNAQGEADVGRQPAEGAARQMAQPRARASSSSMSRRWASTSAPRPRSTPSSGASANAARRCSWSRPISRR